MGSVVRAEGAECEMERKDEWVKRRGGRCVDVVGVAKWGCIILKVWGGRKGSRRKAKM